jgi:RNA polymerase sigma factor (sigma-70 family)
VKLYVAWPRIRRDGREEAYVRQIIVRAHIDETRRPHRRESAGLGEHDLPAPAGPAYEERSALFEALQSLPLQQRKVVVLRHWLGLSVRETATELAINEGTVKSHSSRGLAHLEATLAESEPGTRHRG